MSRIASCCVVLWSLLALGGALPLAAQSTIRLGSELQVNSYTTGYQLAPAVAADVDGDFVVVWNNSTPQDGDGTGIFAQRFSAAGSAVAVELQVNSFTTSEQSAPSVAMEDTGEFIVVWASYLQDGSDYGIFGRRFDSGGSPLAVEFKVNTYTLGNQSAPKVAADGDGDFVVVWQSSVFDGSSFGIIARRFDAAGTGQAVEFKVNTYITGSQASPDVDLDADGDFVVTWISAGQDGSDSGVFARRFDSAGAAQAVEFQVNLYTTGAQIGLSVDRDDDGDFVVAWSSTGRGIFARRFSSSGAPQAAELRVNDESHTNTSLAAVALDGDGDFVVSWSSYQQDGSGFGLFARAFDASGVPREAELQVNTYTTGHQAGAAITQAGNGRFVVTWPSFLGGQDGSSSGIFAQRLAAPAPLDIDANGSAEALADGLLLLRHLFGFTGNTLVSGAVDLADCARCGAAAIQAYLEGDPAAGAPPPEARPTIAMGSELQVNSYVADYQQQAAAAVDSDGDFVVAWESRYQDGSGYGVFARRFDASGAPIAVEFQVNSYTSSFQNSPVVAMRGDGSFVVVWQSNGQDGSSYGVFARRFDTAGAPQAAEFMVNVYTSSFQHRPSVAMDGSGNFLVTWTSNDQDGAITGLFGRRFDAAGSPLAVEFQVNSYTTSSQFASAAAMDADGDFVVTWVGNTQDGSGDGIFGRRFDAVGSPQAVEFQVNTYTTGSQTVPFVGQSGDGRFVIAWTSAAQDGSSSGVFARRFSSSGSPQATELQVNTRTSSDQIGGSVALDDAGGFILTWTGNNQDGSSNGVFSRRFDAAGSPQAAELQINTYTPDHQADPAVASNGDGDFVVAWTSYEQDGSSYGVFARAFATFDVFDIDADGETAALTDGLLALRFLFGFTGATLVSGAVDADCTRCTAGAIETYLQTLI